MKILKIFGIVVGIHVFALLLIFAIPGCSSTTKPAPQPADTVAKADAPMITVPNMASAPGPADPAPSPVSSVPTGFNPDAPATYGDASASSGGVHFTPTRPNSAAASALLTPAVSDVTPAATYSVKSGDSLWTIAKKNHIPVSELATANSLRTTAVLHEGQKLIIPGKAVSSSASHASASSGATTLAATTATKSTATDSTAPVAKGSGDDLKHTVKAGETLGMIARKYGVRSKDIAVRNNIADPQKLRAGTELIIPGWRSTAGKSSGKSAATTDTPTPKVPTIGTDTSSTPSSTDSESTSSTAPANNNVPVIQIDENPITPAPKS
jgi:LysM repeat protein